MYAQDQQMSLNLATAQTSEQWFQQRLGEVYGWCEVHVGTSLDGYAECDVCVAEAIAALPTSPWVDRAIASQLPVKHYR